MPEVQQVFMPEVDDQYRLEVMRSNFESKFETYYKQLTEEEIEAKQASVSKNWITIFKKENELKQIKARFKEELDPLKDDNIKMLTEIDTGQEQVDGELFFMPDYEKNIMITYDAKGQYVSQRRLKPGENQQRLGFQP